MTDLIRHETIRTTETKAREVRRMAERVVTYGKRGDLAARRRAAAVLTDKGAVRKLFDELAPRYESRAGGYTRMFKLGRRKGDAASEAIPGAVAVISPAVRPNPVCVPPNRPSDLSRVSINEASSDRAWRGKESSPLIQGAQGAN